MDINEYISSGILELYVAGSLSADERREVEVIARQHSEVRDEIDAIAATFCALTATQSITPRSDLREAVLGSVQQMDNADRRVDRGGHSINGMSAHRTTIGHTSSPVPGRDLPTTNGADETSSSRDRSVPAIGNRSIATTIGASRSNRKSSRAKMLMLSSPGRYLLAASIAIAVISSAAAVYLAYQWKSATRELASLSVEKLRIAADRDALKRRLDRNRADIAVLVQDENRVVRMKGLPTAPGAAATVYWNPGTHELHLDRGNLPAVPAGRQYQLWAIADGKPVDAGILSKDQAVEGLQKMKDIIRADTFAVTLEPDGGSASPTFDAMYVLGRIDKRSI